MLFALRGLPGAYELRRAQLCSGAVKTAGGVLWEFYGDYMGMGQNLLIMWYKG